MVCKSLLTTRNIKLELIAYQFLPIFTKFDIPIVLAFFSHISSREKVIWWIQKCMLIFVEIYGLNSSELKKKCIYIFRMSILHSAIQARLTDTKKKQISAPVLFKFSV